MYMYVHLSATTCTCTLSDYYMYLRQQNLVHWAYSELHVHVHVCNLILDLHVINDNTTVKESVLLWPIALKTDVMYKRQLIAGAICSFGVLLSPLGLG